MSLLFGLLLGDFVGGGAVIIAAKTILQTSYSRDVETSADAYAVDLMKPSAPIHAPWEPSSRVLLAAAIAPSSFCLTTPRPRSALML